MQKKESDQKCTRKWDPPKKRARKWTLQKVRQRVRQKARLSPETSGTCLFCLCFLGCTFFAFSILLSWSLFVLLVFFWVALFVAFSHKHLRCLGSRLVASAAEERDKACVVGDGRWMWRWGRWRGARREMHGDRDGGAGFRRWRGAGGDGGWGGAWVGRGWEGHGWGRGEGRWRGSETGAHGRWRGARREATGGAWAGTGLGREDGGERDGRRMGGGACGWGMGVDGAGERMGVDACAADMLELLGSVHKQNEARVGAELLHASRKHVGS